VRLVTEQVSIAVPVTLQVSTQLATEQEYVLLVMEQEGGAKHAKEQDRAFIATMVSAVNVREVEKMNVAIVLVVVIVPFVVVLDYIIIRSVAHVMAMEYVNYAKGLVQQENVADAVGMVNAVHAKELMYAPRAKATLYVPHAGVVRIVQNVVGRVIAPYATVSPNAVLAEVMVIVPSVITATGNVPIVMV